MQRSNRRETALRVIMPGAELTFPQKVNVHLCLHGAIDQLARAVNQTLCDQGPSEICFSAGSFFLPHVTLNMGWVEGPEQLSTLMARLGGFAENHPALILQATRLYAVEPKRRWIFIGVDPAGKIIAMKKALHASIRDILRAEPQDVVNQEPHITVGYMKDGLKCALPPLASYAKDLSSKVDSLGISFCGPRGTCVGRIQEYGLDVRA